jgi:antitoxin (DNA-binding transcriptional repressor) of toxin-antitoxin stability system
MFLLAKRGMKEIGITKFKSQCETLLEEVGKSRQPIRITHRGKSLVEVVPLPPTGRLEGFLGSGRNTFDILDDDIVGPIIGFR